MKKINLSTKESHKFGCLICGEELHYGEEETLHCMLCGKDTRSNVSCPKGHFVCDACHGKKALVSLMEEVYKNTFTDPIKVAQSMMDKEGVHMHGPEHHSLVALALLVAYKNAGGEVDFDEAAKEILRRGSKVPGGVCGNWGSCGASISVGIFFSVLSGATPLTTDSWALSNRAAALAHLKIAELGGPRCCKRNTFTALLEASKVIEEAYGVKLYPVLPVCTYFPMNRQCLLEGCPYYPKTQKLKQAPTLFKLKD